MSEKEKKSTTCDGSTGVMTEQSPELRLKKQSHRSPEMQQEPPVETHQKRSRGSVVPSVAAAIKESGKCPETKELLEEHHKHNVTKKKSSTKTLIDVSQSEALPNVEIKTGSKSKQTDGTETTPTAALLATGGVPLASPLPNTVAPIPSTKIANTASTKVVMPVANKVASIIPSKATTIAKVSPALSTPVAPVHGSKGPTPETTSVLPVQEISSMNKMTSTQKVPPSQTTAQQKRTAPDPDPSPNKVQPKKQSSHLVQPIPQPSNIEDEITIDKSAKKDDEESITEDIAELRSPEASKKLTSWSDDEEASGLSHTDSRGGRVTRAVRQLFCCGQPLDAPSEDNISYARDHFGGGI